MADGGEEQVRVSSSALAQTFALLTEDWDEETAQARRTASCASDPTYLVELVRKFTGNGDSRLPSGTMRRAEVPPPALTYICCAVAFRK